MQTQTDAVISSPKFSREFSAAQILFTASPVELSHQIDAREVLNIVDVRDANDFAGGHLPGARNLPRNLWADASLLRRDTMNVLYGPATDPYLTAMALVEFSKRGFPVMEMKGGFEAWKECNLPVEREAQNG